MRAPNQGQGGYQGYPRANGQGQAPALPRGGARDREDRDASPTKGNLGKLLNDPQKLEVLVRRRFQEFSKGCRTHMGKPYLIFEDMDDLVQMFSQELQVNARVFGEISQMFWRFDFGGDGKLDQNEGTELILFMLRRYRDHTNPPEPGEVRLGGKIQVKRLRDQYEITKKLGEGGQGTALLAKDNKSGGEVCVKMYDKSNPSASLEDITQEFELLIGLQHPRLAHVFEIFQDRSNIYVVQEPYYGGDLSEAIQKAYKNGVKVNEAWLSGVMYQCVVAVNYLHSQHVMHCDLKEPNVMLASNSDYQNPQVVVIDFGLANQFHSKSSPGGTPGYMPPEVWPPQGLWTPKGDVFSIGVMMYSLRTGQSPFVQGCQSIEEVMSRTQQMATPDMNKADPNIKVSPELAHLVSSMLDKQFLKRPSMLSVMNHPWLNGHKHDHEANFHASILQSMAQRDQKHILRRALLADCAANQNLAQMREQNDLFIGLDADGDGIITADEVRQGLAGQMTSAEIEKLISVLIGENGEVAYDEFMGQLIAAKGPQEKEMLQHIFNELDTHHHGYINASEVKVLLERPAIAKVLHGKTVEEVMPFLDKNGTGQVSFEDFTRAIYGTRGDRHSSIAEYRVGQDVEYFSPSFSIWMPCEVSLVDENTGAIQISAKPDFWFSASEAHKRVRPSQVAQGSAEQQGGEDDRQRSPMDKAKLAGLGRQIFAGGITPYAKNSTEHIEEQQGLFHEMKGLGADVKKDLKGLKAQMKNAFFR